MEEMQKAKLTEVLPKFFHPIVAYRNLCDRLYPRFRTRNVEVHIEPIHRTESEGSILHLCVICAVGQGMDKTL